MSVLQKTYDESYLTCSTAVYYESQVGSIDGHRRSANARATERLLIRRFSGQRG